MRFPLPLNHMNGVPYDTISLHLSFAMGVEKGGRVPTRTDAKTDTTVQETSALLHGGITAFGLPCKEGGKPGLIFKNFFTSASGRNEDFVKNHCQKKGQDKHYEPIMSLWGVTGWKFNVNSLSLLLLGSHTPESLNYFQLLSSYLHYTAHNEYRHTIDSYSILY